MTVTYIEGALDALAAYLQANWAAKVSTLATRYSDAGLVDAKAWYLGNLPQEAPEYPSIALVGTGVTPGMQFQEQLEQQHGFTIAIIVGEDNGELRFRRLSRYAVGMLELLQPANGPSGYRTELNGLAQFTDILAEAPYLQSLTLPILMNSLETY